MKNVFIIVAVIILTSCASIPQSTLSLSMKLEQQMQALKIANEGIINTTFDEKERRMLTYLDEVLFPKYLEDIFKDAEVDEIWQEMVESSDLAYRYKVTVWLNSQIHNKYLRTKDSLLIPIQNERKLVLSTFNKEFNSAIRMNGTITRNIASVKEIDEIYEKHASKFINLNRLDSIVTTTMHRIDNGLDSTQKVTDLYNNNKQKIDNTINKTK